jgi:hypothetical protein
MQAASHLMVAITGAGAETGALAGRPSVRRYSQCDRRVVMMKLGIDVERHDCLEPNLHKDGR